MNWLIYVSESVKEYTESQISHLRRLELQEIKRNWHFGAYLFQMWPKALETKEPEILTLKPYTTL